LLRRTLDNYIDHTLFDQTIAALNDEQQLHHMITDQQCNQRACRITKEKAKTASKRAYFRQVIFFTKTVT